MTKHYYLLPDQTLTSLSTMETFPVSTVKIDGSFIKAINKNEMNNTIVKNIINFAKGLNLETVAECVETKEQVDFLIENGCHLAQGFYYFRPMPAEELTPILLGK